MAVMEQNKGLWSSQNRTTGEEYISFLKNSNFFKQVLLNHIRTVMYLDKKIYTRRFNDLEMWQ